MNLDKIRKHGSNTDIRIADPKLSENFIKILTSREKIMKRSMEKIEFSKPFILKNNNGIIYPNTINVIQGKKGVHKSRLTELICSVLLNIHHKEFIGLYRRLNQELAILYVDTERNIQDQFPYAIQKIRTKSGFEYNQDYDVLDFISLIDISRSERFEELKKYLNEKRKNMPQSHFFIVLDVVTDCVENFNDPRESMKLIDLMNEMINQGNVTFLCVIHENPGGEKARGHLGTEIINKSSQVMQISYANDSKDLICLKFLHSRNTKPLEEIFLVYSEEEGGLVEANEEQIKHGNSQKQEKATIYEVKNWFVENVKESISKSDLISKMKSIFNCGDRTLESRIKELHDDNFIYSTKKGNEVYYLITEKPSRNSQPPIYDIASCEDLFSEKNDNFND